MNETLAIRLFRTLIGSWRCESGEFGSIPVSRDDLCCGPHAIVAALTLSAFGVKTRIARGRVLFITKGTGMPVLGHYFVVRESDNKVFDSSITFPLAEHPPVD